MLRRLGTPLMGVFAFGYAGLVSLSAAPDSKMKHLAFHVDNETEEAREASANSVKTQSDSVRAVTDELPPTTVRLAATTFATTMRVTATSRLHDAVRTHWSDYRATARDDDDRWVSSEILEIRQLDGVQYVPKPTQGYTVIARVGDETDGRVLLEKYDSVSYACELVRVNTTEKRVSSVRYALERSRPFVRKAQVDALRSRWLSAFEMSEQDLVV